MSHAITHKSAIILLVGAGPTNTNMILSAAAHASSLIAADGGFKAATDAGLDVTLVIGDMDSQSEPLGSQNVLKMTAQDTTDFEKCLQVCDAEVFLGVGFLGGRLDHQMAAFSALLRDKRVVILMDDDQLVFIVPPEFQLKLEHGTDVAFYPLVEVRADAVGLQWPLYDAEMAPGELISTSNKVDGSFIKLKVDRHGLLAILPVQYLATVIKELRIGSSTK
ncbi:MAG: thiamine diphosphokinase [Planktomarina sp.]|nr:thiamine diphosphokinase [Planktomarina sp.]